MLNHWLNYIICQDILTGSGAPGISRKGANGVSTNGAAAKVRNFDRLGKKVRPGTFWNIKVG